MANAFLYIDGLDDVIKDFDRIVGDIEFESVIAMTESLGDIAHQMKINANSVFTDGYSKGVVTNSINFNVSVKDGIISSSVGVYDMSRRTNSTDRRLPASVLAHMYEFGIVPHYTTAGNKPTGRDGKPAKVHQGSAPRPFLAPAFDSGAEGIFTNIMKRLDNSIDK